MSVTAPLAGLKVVERRPRWVWVIEVVAATLFVLVNTVGVAVMFVALTDNTDATNANTADTNHAVRQEIPGLQRQLADERQAREDAEFVLTEQAVPAIVAMSKQIEQLGGKPPQVILKAPDRPTTSTTAPGK